ncbi:MAG: hypothetical protein II452_01795, partial [Paludibacteraceae bacterium]|nr:hypothetical protein [Paludibacteraceae bacterium]
MLRQDWHRRVVIDLAVWLVAVLLCMLWRWIADKSAIGVYWAMFGVLAALWVLIGMAVQVYRSYKETWFWQAVLALLLDAGILIGLCWLVLPHLPWGLSAKVATWTIMLVGAIETIVVLVEHYWKYATNMTVPVMQVEHRPNAEVTRPDEPRSEASMESIHQSVLSVTTEEDYLMLLEHAKLDSRQTKAICDRNRFAFLQIPDYQYNTLVDLTLLNDAKGINRRFCIVNQKLPDNGRYVCCYRPQEYIKHKILTKYPWGINWLVYCIYFFDKRVLPRLALT